MKKTMIIFVASLLTLGGAALAAQETGLILPDNPLYHAGNALEEAQADISENAVEQVVLRNERVGKKLALLEEVTREGKPEFVDQLLEEFDEQNRNLREALDGVGGPDAEKIYELVTEANKQRSERLEEMIADDSLPQEARDGVAKALENQEQAMMKMQEGLDRAQEAREKASQRAGEAGTEQAPEQQEQSANDVVQENIPVENENVPPAIPNNGTRP